MTNTVIANGHTYTDDDDPDTGMGAGGFRQRLLPMLSDVMHDTEIAMTESQQNADEAAASAASAVNAPGTNSTSTSSISVTIASKSIVTQTAKAWVIGAWVIIARTAAPSTTWMFGQITAYDSGTGALTVNVTRVNGSGTFTDWTISLSAASGKDTGGSSSVAAPATVSATSAKYVNVGGQGSLKSTNISGSGAAIAGPSALVLRNNTLDYPVDMMVTTGSTERGFIRSGASVRVDATTFSPNWSAPDLLPYGIDVNAQITLSTIVAGTGGVWVKAYYLPASNATLLLIHGASLHAVVFNPNSGFSSPILIRSALSAAGGDGEVVAAPMNDGTDNVMVSSCPTGATTMQTVLVTYSTISGLALGTVAATTLGTASTRIVDLRIVPNSVGNTTLILSAMASTTIMQNYGIVVAPGATTMTVGATRNDTTVGGFAATLRFPAIPLNDVYLSVTSTASTLSIKAVTINPTTGVQTLGTSATTTVTSAANIFIRETGDGAVITFVNTLPKLSRLTMSDATPVLATPVALTTSITTLNSYGVSPYTGASSSTCVTGTDSSGRFLAELLTWDYGTMVSSGAFTVAMTAAITPVWVPGTTRQTWQLQTASEVVFTNDGGGSPNPNIQRMANLGQYAQTFAGPEANYPRHARPRTTITGLRGSISVTDGAKPSLQVGLEQGLAATPLPFSLINNMTFACVRSDNAGDETFASDLPGQAWLAVGPAPMTLITLQRARYV